MNNRIKSLNNRFYTSIFHFRQQKNHQKYSKFKRNQGKRKKNREKNKTKGKYDNLFAF